MLKSAFRLLTGAAAATLLAVLPPGLHADEASREASWRPEVRVVEASSNTAASPADVGDLQALQDRIRKVVDRAVPATVGLVIGGAQGSGVIVSPDGYVLTAAHVSGSAGRDCQVILPDGRRLRGITLGRDSGVDAGLVKIEELPDEPLPYAEIGASADLGPGTWTVATGHPGGYQTGRPPVVRVGRLSTVRDDRLQTDNTLVGGDSGGPLFDLDARVIGIHSRISGAIETNIHVPSERFVRDWDRLAAGDEFGGRLGGFAIGPTVRADDGLRVGPGDDGRPIVDGVLPGSPAESAGLQPGDVVVRIGTRDAVTVADLVQARQALRPGRRVNYEVRRDGRPKTFEVRPVAPGDLRYPSGRPPIRAVAGIDLGPDDTPGGVRLMGVAANGPARAAGLRGGDVVTAVNGVAVDSTPALVTTVGAMRPGDRVRMTFRRGDDAPRDVDVTLVDFADLQDR